MARRRLHCYAGAAPAGGRPQAPGMPLLRTVAFLIDTMACDTQGTQKQLLETIRRLDRSRWEPHLVCLWESPWMRTAALPCPVHVLGHAGFLKPGFPAVLARLRRLWRELDADLVHVFFDEAVFVAWLAAGPFTRRPVLVSSRRDMGLGAANQPWYHRLFPLVLPLANRRFAGIVANAEMVRRHAARRERTPEGRFTVLRNGVELPPLPPPRPATRPGGTRVAVVASLTPVKRHDLLLEAWAALPPALRSQARLHVLGDGPLREPLGHRAQALGIAGEVVFEGAVADVPARLAEMDLAVLCSDREGLSNAVLEAMAAGLPVVATDVGGNPELVGVDTGLLVPAGDRAGLSAALAALLGDAEMRRRLGGRARERVSAELAWDGAMAALTGWYEKLLAAAPRR